MFGVEGAGVIAAIKITSGIGPGIISTPKIISKMVPEYVICPARSQFPDNKNWLDLLVSKLKDDPRECLFGGYRMNSGQRFAKEFYQYSYLSG